MKRIILMMLFTFVIMDENDNKYVVEPIDHNQDNHIDYYVVHSYYSHRGINGSSDTEYYPNPKEFMRHRR